MEQYVATPASRKDLRKFAYEIRKAVGWDKKLGFPVMIFFELFPELMNKILDGSEFEFNTEIVQDHELPPNIHAQYNMDDNCIYVKQSVYDGACRGNGRDRMTIIHEIAHALLHGKKTLNRSIGNYIPTYCDPEWQAKCLAGEIMVPAHLVNGMSSDEVATACGVSLPAASYQLSTIKK